MESRYTLVLLLVLLPPVSSEPCPQALSLNCTCSRPPGSGWSITCEGHDIVNISRQLPPTTHHFQYTAMEMFVQLSDTDFSHVPQLKALVIKDPGDRNVLMRKISPTFGSDKMFQKLAMLQNLSININWEMESKLPNLFHGLPNLEVLDLSNTRLMNIDNLIHSLQGLINNTKVTTLNLWNIKTMLHSSSNLKFQLDEVLAPLSMSKLEVLNIGYNAFRSVSPGILQYAPHLKQLIVRNNVLIPILTSSLMIEVMLHDSLIEADFSEQGYRPATDSSRQLLTDDTARLSGIQTLPELLQLIRGSSEDGSVTQQTSGYVHGDYNIPQQVVDFLKRYLTCAILLYEDTCNIFKDACQPVKKILMDDHPLFCALLKVFFRWQFSDVHCSYIPSFAEIIRPHCGACLVIPSRGSLKKVFISNLNVYDNVRQFANYQDRPLCFYPNTLLQQIDMAGNVPHGYPEVYKTFDINVTGLPNLKFLNVSYNSLRRFVGHFSTGMPALEHVNASHNLITLADEQAVVDVARSLQFIDLSHNSIKDIAINTFTHLADLCYLDLSHNLIAQFKVNMSCSVLLKHLDLSSNNLNSLPQFTIDQLNDIALSNSSQIMEVNLQANPLLCTCATRDFVDWVRHLHPKNLVFVGKNEYVCTNKNSDRVSLDSVSTSWWFECNQPAIYSSIAVVVIVIMIGIRKRFYLYRVWYRLTHTPSVLDQDEQHEFDASVCYHKNDEEWIQYEMKKHLHHIKATYVEEMVALGQRYPAVVNSLLPKSRRSILVLSPEFTECYNCMYQADMVEEKMGRHGNKSAIFVVLRPLSTQQSNKVKIDFSEHPHCFRWRENNRDAQDLFWEQLVDVVRSRLDESSGNTVVPNEARQPLVPE